MNTGKNWKAVAAAAGFIITLSFTGCGGGDSGDGQAAPAALEGRSYDFSPNTGGQTAVSFTSPTAYTFMHETGAVEQGDYQATLNGNTWTATLRNTTGGQQVYVMTFATGNGGTFVLHRDGEDDRFGPFAARSAAIPSGDVNTPPAQTPGDTTAGDPPPTPSTDYNGFAPVSIGGRTMFGTRTFTSTGPTGQTHTYTFGSGTFHDSDAPEESDGTFVYTGGHSSATLNLIYTGPASFEGDKHNITMQFTQKDKGTFQSTYDRGDGTIITINGNFEFEPIQ